jgi:hypothetical protein
MASFVWGRSPQEAFKNPYEWGANAQFALESKSLLDRFFETLMKKNMSFKKTDTSLKMAEWMLLTDSVDALIEAILNLDSKKHRISARLFRDVIENIDLLTFFRSETTKSKNKLTKWFNGEFISHSISREHLLKTDGEEARAERAKYYRELSSFTHRTYGALCDSYSLGRGEMLVHDTITESRIMVLPCTLSSYYAVIADLIIQLSKLLSLSGFITETELGDCWMAVFQEESVPRRFVQI